MSGLFVFDDFLSALRRGSAGGCVQFAEDLHFGLGVLRATEGAIYTGEEEVVAGFSGIGLNGGLEIRNGVGVAAEFDESASAVGVGFGESGTFGERFIQML